MSTLFARLNSWLWKRNVDFFKEGVGKSAPCISFLAMQIVRFILIIMLIAVWSVNFYINVKKCIMYLNFWALTITLLYMLCIFPSAGRQYIEKQLKEKKKLDAKEHSETWKRAVVLHNVAWPLSVTSAVLFSAYLWHDQLCATYLDFGFAQWREYVVFIASYFPIFVLLIDLAMNQLVSAFRHLVTNVTILALYFLMAYIGQLIQRRPIYANHLAFGAWYGNNYDYTAHRFNETDTWGIATFNECKDYFKWNPVEGCNDAFTVQGWRNALLSTLGLGFATITTVHLLMVFLTRCRNKSYNPERDQQESETQSNQVEGEYKSAHRD